MLSKNIYRIVNSKQAIYIDKPVYNVQDFLCESLYKVSLDRL